MTNKSRRKRSLKGLRANHNGTQHNRDSIPRLLLAREVQRLIKKFDLTRQLASLIVDDAASQVSRLMTGHYREFSADRLVKMLTRLGADVTITIRPAKKLGHRGKVVIRRA